MPENFSILGSTPFQPVAPKAHKPLSVLPPSVETDNLNREDDAEIKRSLGRAERYRFMHGIVYSQPQEAGNRAALSLPVQTQEELEKMLDELAASRESTRETLYGSIFTSDNRQYASLYEPGFTVYRFPVGEQQCLMLARDEDGQFKEVRPARPFDYLLVTLPNLLDLVQRIQEDGVSFQMASNGPLGLCDLENGVIRINEAISLRSIDTKEKKAALLVIVVAHEAGHYVNGAKPEHENLTKYLEAREYDEGYASLEQLKATSENPRFTVLMRNVIKNVFGLGEKFLRIYDEFEERKKHISAEDDDAIEDLENEICRRLGKIIGDERDEDELALSRREKWLGERE